MEISSYLIKATISDVEDFWWGFLFGVVISFYMLVTLLVPMVKRAAIAHGCGQYDKTGQFEWVEVLSDHDQPK